MSYVILALVVCSPALVIVWRSLDAGSTWHTRREKAFWSIALWLIASAIGAAVLALMFGDF